MTDFYHMSRELLPVGTEVAGNGRDKIDPKIEDALEARKPAGMLSRRDVVYGLENSCRLCTLPSRHPGT
jgi:hypothetical protein